MAVDIFPPHLGLLHLLVGPFATVCRTTYAYGSGSDLRLWLGGLSNGAWESPLCWDDGWSIFTTEALVFIIIRDLIIRIMGVGLVLSRPCLCCTVKTTCSRSANRSLDY
jgi:hypothetical protein